MMIKKILGRVESILVTVRYSPFRYKSRASCNLVILTVRIFLNTKGPHFFKQVRIIFKQVRILFKQVRIYFKHRVRIFFKQKVRILVPPLFFL